MLKKIRIKNFYSISSEQELSFEIGKKDVLDDSTRQINNDYINLVSCIVGHNASGKTTLLRALTYILWFVNSSYSLKLEEGTLSEQHKLLLSKLTTIEIEFFNKKILYKYIITLNDKEIFCESLSSKKASRFSLIYKIKRDKDNWDFNSRVLKINKLDKERFKKRKNVALLSSLIDTGYLSEITFFQNCISNIYSGGLIPRGRSLMPFDLFKILDEDKPLSNKVLSYLKEIDLGILDFDFSQATFKDKDNPKEEETVPYLELKHGVGKKQFNLSYFDESDGTQQSMLIFTQVLTALKTGTIVILDEIEDGLHPYVVKKIISLFESKETNPHGAQLFFSTHMHLLLNDRTKTQIFLAERELETEIYRLDEVEGVRNDENYFQKYITGTYGGTPRIDWL